MVTPFVVGDGAVWIEGYRSRPVIAQQHGIDVGAKTGFPLPLRTLLAGLLALVVGVSGTLAINRVLTRSPATTRTAQAVYLPPVGGSPQPAPDFRLRDQAGQLVSLSGLRGQEVLLTFMDPQCTAMCPIVGQEIGAIESSLPANVAPVLLVVSVAPDRTAADVSTFTSHVTWRPGWHWLLGNQAQLQAVWAMYHIAVQPSATDVAHDETLYVVDPHGRIAAGYNAPLPIGDVASTITQSSR
jgi:cytochrome oxidase Cu insertion factor (SCO1/SenC/PrrC family)